MNEEKNMQSGIGQGYIIVNVTTARGAIPLEGAMVTITGSTPENSGVIYTLMTDMSGNTPRVSLPAPLRAESENPDNGGIPPFSWYNIRAEADNFYPTEIIGAPIFDTITAIQPVEMIPTAEYTGEPFETKIYEGTADPLEGSM